MSTYQRSERTAKHTFSSSFRPRLYPLPYFSPPFRSFFFSRRVQHRYAASCSLIMAVNCWLFALNILFSPRHHSSASNLYSSFCFNWSASKNAFFDPIFPIYSTSSISAAQHRLRTHVFNSVRSFLRVLGRPSWDVCDQLFSFSTCQLPSSCSSIGPITRDRSHHDDTLSVYKYPFQPHNANVQS